MPHGLPRKIRIAFIVQMVMASLAILVAFYVVATLFKYGFIQATLQDEARHFWQLYEASPAQPPPNNFSLRGYLVEAGYSNLSLPAHLRPLAPGFHDLAADGQLMAYRHTSFWQCMDTLRDKILLQSLWDSGKPPWRIWE